MSRRIQLFDVPPDGRTLIDWTDADDVILTLIDNPGKWALVRVQEQRSVTHLRARYGNAFAYKTHQTDKGIEVWASYSEAEE